jgi:hypothetical protein
LVLLLPRFDILPKLFLYHLIESKEEMTTATKIPSIKRRAASLLTTSAYFPDSHAKHSNNLTPVDFLCHLPFNEDKVEFLLEMIGG